MSFQRLTSMSDQELTNEIASLKRTAATAPGTMRMLAQQRLHDAKAERDRRQSNPNGLTGLICVMITVGAIAANQMWGLPYA